MPRMSIPLPWWTHSFGAGLIGFCGIVIPYAQINVFWRYWLYWLDPFTYLIGGLLGEVLWGNPVHCGENEWVKIEVPSKQTCGSYMNAFIETVICTWCRLNNLLRVLPVRGWVAVCAAIQPKSQVLFLERCMHYNPSLPCSVFIHWPVAVLQTRITALFCISTYLCVFLMMKLCSQKTKTARSE